MGGTTWGSRGSRPRTLIGTIGAIAALAALGVIGSCHTPTVVTIVQPAPGSGFPVTSAVAHAESGDTIVNARFHNVRFHMWPGVALDLRELHGRMLSRRGDGVVSFDDPHSFLLDIDTGDVALPAADLTRLMNTYVFAYPGAPLRDLSFSVKDGKLVQRGVLHKLVDIPFEMVGDVSVTPGGEMRIHPVSMKICTIPGLGLMKAVGVTLAKLLDLSKAKGVRVVDNDLLINPTTLLPPPAIAGRLVAVALTTDTLVQYFGSRPARQRVAAIAPDTAAPNYMLFRGGTLQFGKLFMIHADMQVIDMEPRDVFDFDIKQYRAQLDAGYHRTQADDGLLVFMPDLAKLPAGARAVADAPASHAASHATAHASVDNGMPRAP